MPVREDIGVPSGAKISSPDAVNATITADTDLRTMLGSDLFSWHVAESRRAPPLQLRPTAGDLLGVVPGKRLYNAFLVLASRAQLITSVMTLDAANITRSTEIALPGLVS